MKSDNRTAQDIIHNHDEIVTKLNRELQKSIIVSRNDKPSVLKSRLCTTKYLMYLFSSDQRILSVVEHSWCWIG